MRILALNAYHGGSHQAFLHGWMAASRHRWTVLTLPPHHWKWRMRHAAITFGRIISEAARTQSWDVIFCTDMLNLAELPAFLPPAVRDLPRVIYFHENQLAYPDKHAGERDLHFGFTNFSAALAADRVWFNSAFHRDAFLPEMRRQLQRMPDESLARLMDEIEAKSQIQAPGIEPFDELPDRDTGVLRLVWASRWEADKGPDLFFEGLRRLKADGVRFQVSVLGQRFSSSPPCFTEAEREFKDEIIAWGFADGDRYRQTLLQADVFVSTARHEFFGIAAVEAVAAGCVPVVPDALAYPEVLGDVAHFYEAGSASSLANAIGVIERERRGVAVAERATLSHSVARFHWPARAAAMDDALEQAALINPKPVARDRRGC